MAEIANVKLRVDELIADTEVTSPLFTGALVATTITASGNLAINTDKFTVAAATGNTVIAGSVGIGIATPSERVGIRGTPSISGARRALLRIEDDTAAAAGVGGGLVFGGKYTSGGSFSAFAGIKGVKENATDSNFAGALSFMTVPSGGSDTERMRIASGGQVLIGTTVTTSATAGDVVLANAKAIRGVNAAGTNTLPLLSLSAGNRTTLTLNSDALAFASPSVATTIGANGAAAALTANPVGYLLVDIAGTLRQIPFYSIA